MAQGGIISSTLPVEIPATQEANVVLTNVSCDSTVYVTSAVYLTGGVAYNALADDAATSNIIGVVESKPTSITCNIRVLGVSPSIFTGLDETKEYYLSDSVAGEITQLPPTASGHVMLKVGQPFSSTEFLVLKGLINVRA